MTLSQDDWESLYRSESPKLWRAVFAYAGSPDIASDAVAEAFTQAISRGDGIRDARAWVWTVAFRTAARELHRDGRSSALGDAEPAYSVSDLLFELIDALRLLSPKQRAVVVLHDYADRPTGEIAQVLGMRLATVHVHLSQGRKRLRRLLEGNDE